MHTRVALAPEYFRFHQSLIVIAGAEEGARSVSDRARGGTMLQLRIRGGVPPFVMAVSDA